MVEHMSDLRQKLDVTELMTRIEAGGPKMAVCTENPVRVDDVMESPKLAE
jgi:hypothetical protein